MSSETVPNPAFVKWAACTGGTLGLADCGAKPPLTTTVTVDSRVGAEASLTTSGKAGVQVNYTLDAGSVEATLGYGATAVTPGAVKAGEFFSLSTSESLRSGALDGQSPTASASADIVFGLQVDASGASCLFLFGCTSGSSRIIDFDTTTEIIAIDPNTISFAAGLLPRPVSLEWRSAM